MTKRTPRAFLPYRQFTIETPLPPAVALERLKSAVEPERLFRLFSDRNHRSFEGTVVGYAFLIRRVIHYRNSFRPRIRGMLEATGTGSRAHGTMDLHDAAKIFATIWFVGVLVGTVLLVPRALVARPFEPMALMPVGMLVFGALLTLGGFLFEARRALAELALVFDATYAELGSATKRESSDAP